MKQSTKYLKILCNFLAAGIILFLLIFVLPRLLAYFMPFVIGFVLSLIANPIVRFLEKKLSADPDGERGKRTDAGGRAA